LTVNATNTNATEYVGNTFPANGLMQLELLKREGLTPHHYVLEIGCGALVAGIPTMAFLEAGHYVGIDPNKWLIMASSQIQENLQIITSKQPVFLFNDRFDASELGITFDYIFGHSIMSHAAHWQLPLFFENCSRVLNDNGKLIFSIRLTEPNEFGSQGALQETHSEEWVYPGNSFFHRETVIQEALKWFTQIEQKKLYTELIVSTDSGAFHDWFVATK
jgi:cyclopropane fatty-acyl-phospholipid synthase-like methyltransferase